MGRSSMSIRPDSDSAASTPAVSIMVTNPNPLKAKATHERHRNRSRGARQLSIYLSRTKDTLLTRPKLSKAVRTQSSVEAEFRPETCSVRPGPPASLL